MKLTTIVHMFLLVTSILAVVPTGRSSFLDRDLDTDDEMSKTSAPKAEPTMKLSEILIKPIETITTTIMEKCSPPPDIPPMTVTTTVTSRSLSITTLLSNTTLVPTSTSTLPAITITTSVILPASSSTSVVDSFSSSMSTSTRTMTTTVIASTMTDTLSTSTLSASTVSASIISTSNLSRSTLSAGTLFASTPSTSTLVASSLTTTASVLSSSTFASSLVLSSSVALSNQQVISSTTIPPASSSMISSALPSSSINPALLSKETVLKVMPSAATCKGAKYPKECVTADIVAPLLEMSFEISKITSKAAKAAIVAHIAFESGELKYNQPHNETGPVRNGSGTRNMMGSVFVTTYAKTQFPNLVKANELETLDSLNDNEGVSMASTAWFIRNYCINTIALFDTNYDAAFTDFVTSKSCINATMLPGRLSYWKKAKVVFGI